MKRKLIILFVIVSVIIISDQVSKDWIEDHIAFYQSVEIIPNFFHITHIHNSGGAFGMLSHNKSPSFQKFFLFLTLFTIGLIGFLYFKTATNQYAPALGIALIIGGAIGNLIDRIRLGAVIDFIDVHYYSLHWPAFNVADSAITIGAVTLALLILMKKW